MSFWGPIIGAAIGVFGGLQMQKRQEKAAKQAEQRNQAYLEDSKANDISKTVKAAEKAGINPLTAVRSGAGNYQSNRAIMPSMSGYQFALEAMSEGARSAISYAETYKERALDALFKSYQIGALHSDINLAKAQIEDLGKPKDDGLVYLFNPDGSPKKNAYGQHMYVSPTAAEVFPYMQGYMGSDGTLTTFPHEQLLDMSIGTLPAVAAAITAGQKVESTQSGPTAFRYPASTYYTANNGDKVRVNKAYPDNFGIFYTSPLREPALRINFN